MSEKETAYKASFGKKQYYVMIEREKGRTLRSIGADLELSRERVRQLYDKAKRRQKVLYTAKLHEEYRDSELDVSELIQNIENTYHNDNRYINAYLEHYFDILDSYRDGDPKSPFIIHAFTPQNDITSWEWRSLQKNGTMSYLRRKKWR